MKRISLIQETTLCIKSFILILIVPMFSLASYGQNVQIETKVDKNKILIGDQIRLQYKIRFNPQEYRIASSRIADTFNKFEVVERKPKDTTQNGNIATITQEHIITNFDSGSWAIPTNSIYITPLDGRPAYEKLTDSVLIQVNTVDADTSKPIKPIYDIIEAKKPWWEVWLYFGVAFLALVLIIGIIYYFVKRYKNKEKKTNGKKQVYIAPWDAASDAIQKLIAKELWLNEQEKQHHTRLTDIIRTYLEDAFELDCFEKTSQEIITDVKKSLQKKKYKKRQEELEKLRNIFFTADLVKFAKSKPTEEEHEQSNTDALAFVNSTAKFLMNEQRSQQNNQNN